MLAGVSGDVGGWVWSSVVAESRSDEQSSLGTLQRWRQVLPLSVSFFAFLIPTFPKQCNISELFSACLCHVSPTVWNSLSQAVISDLIVATSAFKIDTSLLCTAVFSCSVMWYAHACDSSLLWIAQCAYKQYNNSNNQGCGRDL